MKANQDDQYFIMKTALLECAIQEDLRTDELYIKQSNKNKNKWAIIKRTNKKIMFVKEF